MRMKGIQLKSALDIGRCLISITKVVVLGAMLGSGRLPAMAAELSLPDVMLWAWQRSENLSYIDSQVFGVAYLECRIVLSGDRVLFHWRDQPMAVPSTTALEPVIRIDMDPRHPPALSDKQSDQIIHAIERIARLPRTRQVQIDFDARENERQFYRRLLSRTRASLPESMPISMTALASWCLFDNWITDLPVQETVPMMFSLGRDRQKVLLHFRASGEFLSPGCCKAVGLSLEDREVNGLMIPLCRKRKIPVRVYFYTRNAWTENKIQSLRSLLGK
jgi:hypothetical protein